MLAVRITAAARAEHARLIEQLELPQENPCFIKTGTCWISEEACMPEGFCSQAWLSLAPYVFALANGTKTFFDGWMKKEGTALVSCNDGFRPVSFLLQAIDDKD